MKLNGIGCKKEILAKEDMFPHIKRNHLRALTIQKSEEIKEEFMSKFKNSDVFLSIDGAKICNTSSIDISIIGYTSFGKFEIFTYDTFEINEHSTEKFKEIGLRVLDELHKKKITVRGIVANGFSAQRAAFETLKCIFTTFNFAFINFFFILLFWILALN